MKDKELKLVITFPSTADAIAMERACRKENAPGRLIPVPLEISDGCGLAWCATVDKRNELICLAKKQGVNIDRTIEMEL